MVDCALSSLVVVLLDFVFVSESISTERGQEGVWLFFEM